MEFEHEFWWEDWVWKEHIIPAWYNAKDKVKYEEQNLGFQMFYDGKVLWMYVGELLNSEDIPRLLDVLLRGDAISRLRAMSCLEEIANDNETFLSIIHAWNEAECQDDLLESGASLTYLPDEGQFKSLQDYAKAIWWRNDPEVDEFEREHRDKLAMIHSRKKKPTKKQLLDDARIPKRAPTELDLIFPWIPVEGEEEAKDQAYAEQATVQTQFDWTPKTPSRPISSPQKPKAPAASVPPAMIPPLRPTISNPPPTGNKSKMPPIPTKKR